jgi:hypothetical protein
MGIPNSDFAVCHVAWGPDAAAEDGTAVDTTAEDATAEDGTAELCKKGWTTLTLRKYYGRYGGTVGRNMYHCYHNHVDFLSQCRLLTKIVSFRAIFKH